MNSQKRFIYTTIFKLVLMSLKFGENISMETHAVND